MTAAVITGASAGLGAEFTRQLVREFPEIEEFWLIARRVGKLEELAQQFPDKKFVCMGLNLLDPKSFRYLGEKLAEQKADVRVLVNNAGCGTTGNIGFGATSADVMRVVDLNVRALTMVTQTVIPFMTRGAKIINVSSRGFLPYAPHDGLQRLQGVCLRLYRRHRRRVAAQGHFRHSRLSRPHEDRVLRCRGRP